MRLIKHLSESMEVWRKKQREKELALSAVERLKVIEKHIIGSVEGYKHPNSIEDLKFLKKYKPYGFWKRIERIVIQQFHPTESTKVMKEIRKKLK